jgi:tetraacyldisaccharide 4'-kinase
VRAPEFWTEDGALARTLAPLAAAYAGAGCLRRALARPVAVSVPVVCVGNLVTGGAGKTPVVLALLGALRQRGETPHALTRGYGGREAGPLRVDPARHDAARVGDEALLLARAAPTWVARDRPAGAKAAVAAGASLVVMDDGFQNPSLQKDLSILVVDGRYGFGNGRVVPAGPLREPLAWGLARADAVVVVGEAREDLEPTLGAGRPVLRADLVPESGAESLGGRKLVAFAGIGRPEKFFASLRDQGALLAETHGFADHHAYRPGEVAKLADRARSLGATLVTTEKDAVRLPPDRLSEIRVLAVSLAWRDPAAIDELLSPFLSEGRAAP